MQKPSWEEIAYFYQTWLPFILIFIALFVCIMSLCSPSYANIPRLPGSNEMDKLTAAGSLLRLIDSFLFTFGARLMAGICVLAAGWNLKEQRFAMALICVFAAVIIGTAPMWVKNIFDIGGGTLFSLILHIGSQGIGSIKHISGDLPIYPW